MSKIKLIVLTLALVMALAVPAMADQVSVFQNNQLVKSVVFKIGVPYYVVNGQTPGVKMDVAPFIQSDRTFVPVRFLGNALGVTNDQIAWDDPSQTATIKGATATLQMTIGKTQIISNGQAKAIDVAPVLKSDRTFLPARFVAEGLGYQVAWDDATQTVVCWLSGQPQPDVSASVNYLNGQTQQPVNPPVRPPVQPPTQQGYQDIKGYKVPVKTDLHFPPSETVDMTVLVLLYKPLDGQYQDLRTILTSKFDNQVVEEVLAYVMQKKDRKQDLPLKKWSVDNYTIEVVGQDVNIQVLIRK